MKRLRAGIIGQGRSGFGIHAHLMRHMPGRYKIAAVCEPDAARLDFARRDLGCDGYLDYRELLRRRDLDLVVNASPSHLHVPISLEVLEAGHNLLCEKPLARYASEVDALIAKSKETGKLLAIFQQSRFAPYFQQVRKVVDSGVLGRVVMVKLAFNGFARRWDWQTLSEFNGGSLLNTGPHPLDQALQLFGTDVMPEVFCLMDRVNTFGDAEDHVKLILSGKNRPTIDLEISSCCAYPLYTYQVYGEKGGLTGDMKHIEWKYFKPEEAPKQELHRDSFPDRGYCGETLKWHFGKWDVPEAKAQLFDVMGNDFYRNVYDAVTSGAPLVITPQQVRQQIAVIEECYEQDRRRG